MFNNQKKKKMKTKSILFTAMATLMLSSCEKGGNEEMGQMGKSYANLTTDTGSFGTRALGNETANGAIPGITSAKILSSASTDNWLHVGNMTSEDLTKGKKQFLVGSSDTRIKVEANEDGKDGTDFSKNVNTRQGVLVGEEAKVMLVGEAQMIAGDNEVKTATVTIAPEMARIEVVNDETTPTTPTTPIVTNLTIEQIYLSNTKLNRDDQSPSKATNFETEFATNGTRKNLTDVAASGTTWQLIDADGAYVVAGFGKKINVEQAIGYNIFPQANLDATSSDVAQTQATNQHPNLILKVKFTREGTETSEYLNITRFKSTNTENSTCGYIKQFKPGNIYKVKLSEIYKILAENGDSTDPDPDPNKIGVDVSVTITTWTEEYLTPEV